MKTVQIPLTKTEFEAGKEFPINGYKFFYHDGMIMEFVLDVKKYLANCNPYRDTYKVFTYVILGQLVEFKLKFLKHEQE